jgi:ubiquinone/menaquinone biosynthesis C-methylase UbiE
MRRLYNWLHRYYGAFERGLDPILDEVVQAKVVPLSNTAEMTALDYACGSGMWTLKIAPHFRAVTGRDQSSGMLSRARQRAEQAGLAVTFREGSILDIDEEPNSVDWAFVSFALHLFPPQKEVEVLRSLLRVARQGVMIVDHARAWSLGNAVVEWLEGSYYDRFIRTDFAAIAAEIGASRFEETSFSECAVLTFGKATAAGTAEKGK